MKRITKNVTVIAFVFAIFGAFAFNIPAEEAGSVWYGLDESGNVLELMSVPPGCEFGNKFCAVEIDESQLLDGEPQFTNVTQSGASNHYIRYVEKF